MNMWLLFNIWILPLPLPGTGLHVPSRLLAKPGGLKKIAWVQYRRILGAYFVEVVLILLSLLKIQSVSLFTKNYSKFKIKFLY